MSFRRLLLTALALVTLASCGRSTLGFGDDGSARRPGQTDTAIRPDVIDDDVGTDVDPDGTPVEICDNGLDEDGDGRIDCDDADCADDPACEVADCPAFELGDAVSIFEPVTVFEFGADTVTATCAEAGLIDATFGWTAPFDGDFELVVDGPGVAVEVRAGTCAGGTVICQEPFGVFFEASAGDDFVFIVEAEEGADLSALFIFGEPTPVSEICDNGIDDDGNGLVDCDDFACDCPPEFEFDCANGFDDDFDGFVDCDDPDCEGSPECTLECPVLDLGNDTGRPVVQSPAFAAPNQFDAPCAPFDQGEVGVAWRAPSSGRWTISTEGSELLAPVYARLGGCFGEDIGCSESGELTLDLDAGTPIVIFVEGFDGSERLLNLSIFRSDLPSEAGQCDDGRDNDGDGRIDCRDDDCTFDPACDGPGSEICDNGIDDDRDRLIDCDDPDCAVSPACRGIERNCANDFDDDRDGLIDCEDPDCLGTPACGGEAEVCFDGVDNDGDGLADCEDPDCFDSPFCFGLEDCTNGFDDDRDGLVDCDDPDCVRSPECRPDVEICFNFRDDDFDGLIDCDDPDCSSAPECEVSSCPDGVLPSALGAPILGGTTAVDASDDANGSCGGSSAPDRAFEWSAPFDGTFTIDTFGSAYDTVLYARAGDCDGFELDCDDDTRGVQSRIEVELAAGETIVIFVDGFGTDAGDFVLSIREAGPSTEVGLCDDGVDNDGDLRTDCGDFDCREDPACEVLERCSNGVDDDGDGAVDCDDPDCFGTRICLGPEDCSNGRDDDGDALVDCDDPSCFGEPACARDEVCFNGLDDDGDLLVDCDDPDCDEFPTCAPRAEVCDNGIDDDGNGLIDCDDRACRLDEACAREEVCFNGFDDDLDGRVDCEDPDCFGSPFCETPIELCANGVDDDDDGAVDCEDPDCFGTEECADVCPDSSLGSTLGVGVAFGSTIGGTTTGGGSCGGDGAPDVTFAWTAPATGTYVFDTDGSTYDTILHARLGGCDGPELACDDDGVRISGPSRFELTLRRNQRVVLFVDGWNDSAGEFQLNIVAAGPDTEAGFCTDSDDNDGDGLTDCDDPDCFADPSCFALTETLCNNGEDDDFDGLVDCDDPDCLATPGCGGEAEICFDGVDNDGDDRVDCEDSDCFDSPFCLFVEDCTNGFDDDRDGRIDCADPDCLDDPACVGPELEQCTDGIDNDLDGRTDCADTDCFLDPSCFFSENCSNGVDDDGDGLTDCADPSCFFDPACPEGEECTNGVDDDGDGQVDCDDPECVFDPVCALSENCTNGIDDDGDGFVDCEDLTCVLDPTCQIPENCFNGVDDDGDGLVDCDDSECAGVPTCLEPACPNDDLGSALGEAVATGSTVGAGNDTSASCGGGSSEDIGLVWTAPRPGRYAIDSVGSGYDVLLALLDGASCEGPELLCDDDTPPLGRQSRLIVDAVRGQSFTILVEGFGGSSGSFVLNIQRISTFESSCDDGDDNDLDGAIDCDDSDCATDIACGAPEDCGNGIDDDLDDLTDCDDPDCADSALCARDEICDNGVDDDDDGRVDCDDSDCFGDDACVEECPAFDLGSALGSPVIEGTTAGAGNDVNGSCFGGSGEDIGFAWRAPENGRYRFDTFGSSYDTQIHVRLGDCDGEEVACDDDTGGTQSAVTVPLTAGSEVVIFVDGFGTSDSGPFLLNITQVLGSEVGFCSDGVDNDADGDTDCDDDDCFADASCLTPEICFNGEDDDRDGAIDCDDPDCFGFPTCGEPEICDNGIDDDLDGRVDCDDFDCTESPACSECPQEDIGTLTGPFVFSAETFDAGDNEDGSCSTGGDEVSVAWTAPAPGRYRASTVGSGGPTTLYARLGCDGGELGCDVDFDGGEGAEILFSVRGGVQVVFFLEGVFFEGTDVSLSIRQIPTNEAGLCFDGDDNDEDGAVDCEDDDCTDDPLCVLPEVCFNGFDDDGDGLTDCEDDDCFGDPACFSEEEICTNGFDDDGDGLTDCADAECVLSPECIDAEDCGNGIDDDGNGRTDCEDPSCSVDPACFSAERCRNGIDDDGDGLVDCEDPSCAFRPFCAGANEEDCGNGVDDDGDGLVDCDDFGCLISFECLPFP